MHENPVRCPDITSAQAMEKLIIKTRAENDSVGGIVECLALNVPAGIGDPTYNSLDADIAKILFNVPAVKGVDFGAGFPVSL